MKEREKALLGLLLLLGASVAVAQKRTGGQAPAASYRLLALHVTGSQRYSEKEILPASGLQLGQEVGEADFKEAVRRLGDSGFFTSVSYSYQFSPAGAKLEFQLTDADPSTFVPAHFENFVWFTDAELLHELQLRIPLFKQELPLDGALADRVEAALQEILDEKKIPARVDYLRESPPEGEKLTGIAFTVEGLEIHIRNVEFPGASADLLPGLQAIARRLVGAPYMRSPLAKVAEVDFLPVCLKRGYLKASFAQWDARVLSQQSGDVEVEAIVPVSPGKVYSTSGVEWKGNSVVKTEELQQLLHLPVGQPADAVDLVNDLEKATMLYRTRGYMVARITSKPLLNDDKSTVHYDLYVVEGDQFRMGDLDILGLDSQAKAHLQAEWKLQPGDPYNGEYPKQFLDQTAQLLPRGVPWKVSYHEAVNEGDKTVDVTLQFRAQ